MTSLAARLQEECDDNMGAAAARAAAEAVTEAVRHVLAIDGSEDSVLLIGMQRRLTDAIVAVERLGDRQVSVTLVREAGYIEGYEAATAARTLRSVS